jgi:hypothetical protein
MANEPLMLAVLIRTAQDETLKMAARVLTEQRHPEAAGVVLSLVGGGGTPPPKAEMEPIEEIDCTCIAPHPACPNCNGSGKVKP